MSFPTDIIGVVVIGRNEGKRLDACLSSVAAAGKIVYVDSASTDDSVEIAVRHGASVVNLDMGRPFTAARARNEGFHRLRELNPAIEFVQFVDGDCEVFPGWITAAYEFLEEHDTVAVVCGRRKERHPDASIYNAMCDREWNTPIGPAHSSGGDSLVRVDAFISIGGFADDQIAHEEPEMCARLRSGGWTIWRIDEAMTWHDAAIMRLGQFYLRCRRAGFGISQYLSRVSRFENDEGRRIIHRSLIWALVLPVVSFIAAFIDVRLTLILLLLYPAQISRAAYKAWKNDGWRKITAVRVASLMMLAKFAETHGTIEFWLKRRFRGELGNILYK